MPVFKEQPLFKQDT